MSKLISIIGAGNGGQAFAGYLSLHGFDVKIFDVVQSTVDILNEKGGVIIEGNCDVTGFGKIQLASTNIEKVMENSEIILIVLPSIYHKDIAKNMAPYLRDGQYVVLNPNASLGVLEFKKELDDCGCSADITLACTATLLFACRASEVGKVVISGQKSKFSASTYPSSKNEEAKKVFKNILPQFDFGEDIIRVSLDNLNAVVHPAPTLLNTGRIESGIDFEYYLDITASQAKIIDELDKERMLIGKAYNVNINSLVDEYKQMYKTKGDKAYEVLTNCEGYKGIKGQKTLKTRYLLEDIPCSLVAFQTLAQIAGIKTPCIDSIVTLAKHIIDEIPEGRTIKNLGLEGISKAEFISMCRY